MGDGMRPTKFEGLERVTLYPHGGGREWSSKMHDEWKRPMGEEYVRADVAAREAVDYLRNVVAPAATTQDGANTIYAAADALSRIQTQPTEQGS